MKDSRWERAKEIFDEARGLAPELRSSFIDAACSGDKKMQAEVEMLLASYESDFLEENVLGAANLLIESGLTAGQMIGRYRIGELIGSGGMGQVFRAEDTELDRSVAFKVLHGDIAENDERVRRFIQEAKAASALNHPNILTIYEIGSFEGSRYIVSEYIDGDTLRERMHVGLTVSESLEITCQVAAALKAAHSAGIVHRDIKPENVMLRPDGLVKVLDFGLAKLTEADDLPIDPNSPTLSRQQTSPGLIMGTVAYMSPEQARGQAVDSRTDLWSLGVVFHEMLTGESPFKGESVTDLVTSIIKHDGISVDTESVPAELKPICVKILAKDLKTRYQSAQQLLQDLQGEKKRMEYAIQGTPFVTVLSTEELKTQLIRRRPTLSAEYIVAGVKRHKYATLTAVALIVASAIGLSVYKFNGATPPTSRQSLSAIDSSTTESDLKFSRMPISGHTKEVVISPDGKQVAYLDLPAKGIKLIDQTTFAQTELVPAPDRGYFSSLGFSPDSKFLYYAAVPGGDGYGIMRVAVAGGTSVMVVKHSYSTVSFSPDGSRMVFTTEVNDGVDGQILVLANPDGSNQKTIAKIAEENWIANGPVWSPDGKSIACQMSFHEDKDGYLKMVNVNIADGRRETINEKKWAAIYGSVWLPNGNLVISAKEKLPDNNQETEPAILWSLSPGTEPRAVTSGEIDYQGISATIGGDILVTRKVSFANNLWIAPSNNLTKAVQVTSSGEVRAGFNWTPDGRITMGSAAAGNINIWIMNSAGGERRQLTRDPGLDSTPVVSADGKTIVFGSNRLAQENHIFRMNIDGTDVRQLTNGSREITPHLSADAKWVYYIEVNNNKRDTIRKVSIDGGEPITLIMRPPGAEFMSLDINQFDGRIVYGLRSRVSPDKWEFKFRVGIRQANGKPAGQLIDVPKGLKADPVKWTPDGRAIALLGGIEDNNSDAIDVWTMDLKGKAKRLTDLKTRPTYNFCWSYDGKQLLYSRGTPGAEAVMIRSIGK